MIIAIDFDGTLCENAWPEIGAPRNGVITYAKQKKRDGASLILWTNRKGERLEEAVAWCKALGLEFDAVNANVPEIVEKFGGDTRKVYADEYIDDKARRPEDCERMAFYRRTVRRGK
jgi:histidinol phosphatase-like enzyme